MSSQRLGWLYGLIGMMMFAGSMPATRLAVMGFNSLFLTGTRAMIAGILAILILWVFRQQVPQGRVWLSLAIVALTVVFGFPYFSALALEQISAARALVFVALLPLSTAIFAVIRTSERPSLKFWFFAVLGGLLVMGYMLSTAYHQKSITIHRFNPGDLYMVISVLLCGLGYAEGGRLTKSLGSWQVICWALLLALPFMTGLSYLHWPVSSNIALSAYAGLAYVSIFSMLLGFFFWYHGLALGGIAKVGQIQLLQPFLGLGLSAVLLAEQVTLGMILVSAAVVACVLMSRKYA